MNTLKTLIFAFLLTFITSCGQQKNYVTYKIKDGETMRDVAKRLNMKTKDLLRLNPDVSRKPATNTTIIIPKDITKKEVVKAVEVEKDTSIIATENNIIQPKRKTVTYQTHTVVKGETVYFITKKYGITKEELINLNPEFKDLKDNKLSINQVLKVKKIISSPELPSEDEFDNFVTHKVKPKETVYGITHFYNVSKDSLIAINSHLPNLKNDLLNIGDIVKIRFIEKNTENTSEINLTESPEIYIDTIKTEAALNLSILLPFKADKYISKNPKEIFDHEGKSKLANIVTDFYMGAEIAIDSIRKQGVHLNVNVFDTGNRGNNIENILSEDKLNDTDVIIGPLYSDKVKLVTDEVSVPVIYPLYSKNQSNFSSSKIVKTAPDYTSNINALTSYLKRKHTNETIFVVGDGEKESDILVSKLVVDLKQKSSIKDVIVLKPIKNYIKKERFTDKMKPNSHSWVIMTCNNNIALEDALNSMVALPEKVTAQVFAVEKNEAYDKIDHNKLARINFAYATNQYSNEEDVLTKSFYKKYNNLNNSKPSEYAIKGFDITYDILMRLASGDKLTKTFKKGASMRIANKFFYQKKLFGPANNHGVFLVKYNKDLTFSRLD